MKLVRTLLMIGLAANAALYSTKGSSADTANKCQKPDGSIVYKWGDCPAWTKDVSARPKAPIKKGSACSAKVGEIFDPEDYENRADSVRSLETKRGTTEIWHYTVGQCNVWVGADGKVMMVGR